MSWVLVVCVAAGAPAWTLGTNLRAEQRVGTLMLPGGDATRPGAALSLQPSLRLQLDGPRTAFEAGYTPSVFVREAPGDATATLLNMLEVGLDHRATRRLRLSLGAGLTAGAMQYTQQLGDEVPTAAGRPFAADIDMFGALGQAGAVYTASRRVVITGRGGGGYLGPGIGAGALDAAASYPPQVLVHGNLQVEVALDELCGIGGEARARRVEFLAGPELEIYGAPMNWRCRAQRGGFGLTAGVAVVRTNFAEPEVRAMPLLGARGDLHLWGGCDAGAGAMLEPVHDPVRQNVASRASVALTGLCIFAPWSVSLEGHAGMPTPIELRTDVVTPAQDMTAGFRLAGAYLFDDDTAIELGTQTTWRRPPIGGDSVVEVLGFVGARTSLGFGSQLDEREEAAARNARD